MLRVITGRAGSGKTSKIMGEIRTLSEGDGGRLILLVPLHFSHESERLLARTGGARVCMRAEVLTVPRLASRVFAESGGAADRYLDAGGRILAMSRAFSAVRGELRLLPKSGSSAALMKNLVLCVDELKSWRVPPEALFAASEKTGGPLSKKLSDIALVYASYSEITGNGAFDPRDLPERLAEAIPSSRYMDGARVFIDGFSEFTPQELLVVRELLKRAPVTVTLTCDDPRRREAGLFSVERHTFSRLERLAEETGALFSAVHLDAERDAAPELRHLERHLFDYAAAPFRGPCPAISLNPSASVREECEFAVSHAVTLARDFGYRWREIGITAHDFSRYARGLESAARRRGVPAFIDRTDNILEKSVPALAASALKAVSRGFSREHIFAYLKTGLSNISRDECDILENYALSWNIKGRAWEKSWTMHPDGFGREFDDAACDRLRLINGLRERAVTPLLRLREASGKTAASHVRALYAFLEEIGLPPRLSEISARLTEAGDAREADQFRQIWNVLCDALDQCDSILASSTVNTDEFRELFTLILSEYDVGSIPQRMDAVAMGEDGRLRHRRLKCLIFLGMDDGTLPLPPGDSGLLTDSEREQLLSLDIQLSPGREGKLAREFDAVYAALSLPTERLALSYPRYSGAENRPSLVLGHIRAMFPETRPVSDAGGFRADAPAPLFELCSEAFGEAHASPSALAALALFRREPELAPDLLRLEYAADSSRGPLSPGSVKRLYGERPRLSASRADSFQSCRFAYFVRYGLGASARRESALDAPQSGSFLHYVLERLVREIMSRGGFGAVDAAETVRIAQKYADEYAETRLSGLSGKPPRFLYLYNRLLAALFEIVQNMREEFSASSFVPMEFELKFSGQDGVFGIADRVDAWESDGKTFLRIVDYKTGSKSFDLSEIYSGMGLQTLIYLFMLERLPLSWVRGAPVPAGVLYMPVRRAAIDAPRDITDGELRALREKKLRRSGLVLDDMRVLDAMEASASGARRFVPVKVLKDGTLSAESSVASAREFGLLRRHVEKTLAEIGREIAKGGAEANPYLRGRETPCDYCEFMPVCGFDPGRGDRVRVLPSFSKSDFWRAMEVYDERTDR